MVKNYFSEKIKSKIILLSLFVFSLFTNEAYSQITITKPNLSIPVCSGFPSSYYTIGNIVLEEVGTGNRGNFSTGTDVTLILSAPANFEFLAGSASLSYAINQNISATPSIVTTSNTITITYSCTGTNKNDQIIISNLQIRAINTSSTGNITRTGGTGVINGLINGTTVTNTLTSTSGTPPSTAVAGANQTLAACVTSTTVNANTPAVGTGVWSLVSGVATITNPNSASTSITGLALGATATLRWTISNSPCSASTSDMTITTTYGSSCISYCNSSGGTIADGISGVNFNTINNLSTLVNVAYSDFTSISTNVYKGISYGLNVYIDTGGNYTNYQSVWIDWNSDGDFLDAGEFYNIGTASNVSNGLSSLCPFSITIPISAGTGTVRMRIQSKYNSVTTSSCQTGFDGEVEDYTLNILDQLPCTTPISQPISLTLTPGGTSVLGTFTAASPAPSNYLVIRNTTGTIPSPVNGTNYTIGATVGAGNIVVDNDSNTSFTATGLSLTTQYYFFVFSFNNSCTGGPSYLSTSPLTGNITTLATNYCVPTGNLNCASGDYIANVTLNTLINNTTCSATGYTNYPPTGSQTTTVTRGNNYNLSIGTGTGNKKHGLGVWIDFNQNQVFTDAGEYFSFGNGVIANSTNTITITIPAGATLGTTRMRVRYGRQTNVSSTSSCTMNGTLGETEDYTITIADPIACSAPSSQPTTLILNATGTTIAGSFTAPSPAPDNYLVVINTTGIAPSPVNTTSYTIGGTVGAGNTVVDNDSNTAFVASGLSPNTLYYIFVFAYNSACSGGPIYNTTSPLNGNTSTINSNYCTPSVGVNFENLTYLTEVAFVGTLNDVTNASTYTSSPRGYQDFTNLSNLSQQAQGEGVNVFLQATNSSYIKAWVDWNKDGVFADPGEQVYNTGGIATYSTTFGFIIPSSTPLGNYRIRIRINNYTGSASFTPCGNINYYGETEDYLFTVVSSCNAVITSVTDGKTCGSGTVVLNAVSTSPGVTQYRWYSTPTGSTLVGTSATSSWTTPSISTTTTYYVTAYNGCESLKRTAVTATISPIPSLTYSPSNPTVCGEGVILDLTATGDQEEVYLIDEKFNSGLGTFTNTNINPTSQDANSQWQNKTSTFVPTQVVNYNVWFPAISSGINGNNFAFSTSDVGGVTIHNQMASATVSSSSFTSLTLSLRMFYSRYYEDGTYLALDYVTIDVSTNGGGNWTEIKRFTEDVGIGTRFETLTYDLSGYINQPNLKVRIQYYGEWCDGLAVDDVKLYGYRPIGTALSWTSSTPVNAFSDPACTIAYVSGTPALNVYVKPSITQLESGTYTFTANATLANGCTTSQDITVTNKSKIWQGLSTDWNSATNWKPNGVPAITDCIVVPSTANNPIISGSSYQAYGKNIDVKSNANVLINTSNNLTINDEVTVRANGLIELKNSSSLVQNVDTAINSGTMKMTRTTRPMTRWAYVYWGSPIAENAFSQIPTEFDLKYRWVSGTSAGTWTSLSSVTSGEGFIARVKNIAPFSTGTGTIDFVYTGTPKNGVVNVNVDSFDSSSLVAGNTVLLANPYPSVVDATKFLQHANNTELGGTLFFWTSLTLYSGTGPYSVTDYGSWNLAGGTGTAPSTDPTNLSLKPNGKIASGQGFFAQAFADGQITFNNSMRETNNNSQFFRTSGEPSIEKNRIWLNLYSDSTFRQTLIGYMTGATDGIDKFYDGDSFTNNAIDIYSIHDGRNLVIQGKGLPFNQNDVVPLGYRVTTNGSYSIAIDELDGLFLGNQNIYLRDNLLNIDHDLKASPYTFITNSGTFNNRFQIVYTTNALGVGEVTDTTTFGMITNQELTINSSEMIKNLTVYDITGKMIINQTEINIKQYTIPFYYPNGVYIAKVKLGNDKVADIKLMH
ncbi:GEVED domain-containing protein [Flavobacterium capsici]|uniref:GEVED domain-containing protein n=1 Tax=Flavobacterium capsici TaxID=3075618 RepID=A0AA96EXR3_9FLAO|nr:MULTISPECIES: GEVED domain-containing protein [unclassified Flavobacterium]WNM20121.1 GEVED domain-containing protein [Flavobacterium sp. PMR2A8]WNM21511.1 GEVED domain-containing protein [Flavobacterium sp. PMTSA4]